MGLSCSYEIAKVLKGHVELLHSIRGSTEF